MTPHRNVYSITFQIEEGKLTTETALTELASIVYNATSRAERVRAYCLIGDIAGRAYNTPWLIAARAAWVLLDISRYVDALLELRHLILAMGRASRNIWLMPFVHSQLSDNNPLIVEAAINATGGLCFPELEETIAGNFLGGNTSRHMQLTAIYALGRMGALSVEERLVPFIGESLDHSKAALTALTEMRSRAGITEAIEVLRSGPDEEVLIAAMRYLAELGCPEVAPVLRRLAREDNNELRVAASSSSRAYKAEGSQDVAERILAALSEKDIAVRVSLARRLRTVPAEEVIKESMMLFDDDPEGIIQILGEVRSSKVAHLFIEISKNNEIPISVRVSAINSIVASQEWVRDELSKIIHSDIDEEIRVAAVHSIGGWAPIKETFAQIGRIKEHVETSIRGAILWALQFTACLRELSDEERIFCEQELKNGINDIVHWIRRRAAYVVANLKTKELAPELINLANNEKENTELRVATFEGLKEIASPLEFNSLVSLFRREDDTEALRSLGRAIASTILRHPDEELDISPIHGKFSFLMQSTNPILCETGVRLAGFSRGGVTVMQLLPFVKDKTHRVREEALTALGRLDDQKAGKTLFDSLMDGEPAIRECAAWALFNLGGRHSLEYLLIFAASEGSDLTRMEIASRIKLPAVEGDYFLPLVDNALEKLYSTDCAYEPLLQLKIRLLESSNKPSIKGDSRIDLCVMTEFPTYRKLVKLENYSRAMNILRTAEALYQSSTELSNADLSSPVVLWIKCMENFLHSLLSPRLKQLQQQDSYSLFEYVDSLLHYVWSDYRIFLAKHWEDSMEIGGISVEVPIRSLPNVLNDFQERRRKRLDLSLSVTEWARLIIFFGVEHPSGVRNLFKMPTKNIDHVIRMTHRLHALAAVRNVVTHRVSIGPSTLEAFRKLYYSSFESITKLI